ncbi:MAG: hypothetical protein OXC44_01635 [Proteobacteria bacterium]|nr:hypothetical protein [Pseudomonadota bacterium]
MMQKRKTQQAQGKQAQGKQAQRISLLARCLFCGRLPIPKTRMPGYIVMVFLGLWVSGCMSFGVDFSTDVSWMEVGETTQMEVLKKLGKPQEIGVVTPQVVGPASKEKVKVWTYYYFHVSAWSAVERKEFRIHWNANHTVRSFTITQNTLPEESEAESQIQTEET